MNPAIRTGNRKALLVSLRRGRDVMAH